MPLRYLVLLLLPYCVWSQQEFTAAIEFNQTPVTEALILVEQTYNVKFSYAYQLLEDKTITLKLKQRTLNEVLNVFENQLQVQIEVLSERYISITSIPSEQTEQLKEVVITSYLAKGIEKNTNATFTIKPKELELLPGLIEADVLESIQELPGVSSPDETATGLNVRGGVYDQNNVLWDGITMYHNGHLFAMISPFNPNITQEVTFYNKATHPRFGDRLSSVVDIKTNTAVVSKPTAGLGFNGISVDGYIETPIIKNKLSILASYRRSYEGFLETPTFHQLEEKVFQGTPILDNGPSEEDFYFKDYNFKINYTPNPYNTIAFSSIHIDNDLNHTYNDAPNSAQYYDGLDTENTGFSVSWFKTWKPNLKQTTVASYSYYSLLYNNSTKQNNQIQLRTHKDNTINDTHIKTEFNWKSSHNNLLDFGAETSFKGVRYNFTQTSNSDNILEKDNNTLSTYALFSNYSFKELKGVVVDLGLRLNYFQQLETLKLQPRILVLKSLTPQLKLQFTTEIKHQGISQIEENIFSNQTLENKLWRVANTTNTPLISGNQTSLGLLYNAKGWSLDIDSYYKTLKGISTYGLNYLNQSFSTGKQRILGTDVYLKKDFNNIKTYISYAFNTIESQYQGINNNQYFTASNQITHSITTAVAYKTKNLQVTLGWKWHTGSPYSPYTTAPDGTLEFNSINTGRLPNYHRLDISTVYNFKFSKTGNTKGKLGLSVRNIYNQKNTLPPVFFGNNTPQNPLISTPIYSLGVTPNLLFRMSW